MAVIDWNKPYGMIIGRPPVPGGRYSQDGKLFRLDGSEACEQKAEPVKKEKPKPEPPPAKKPEKEFVYKPPTKPKTKIEQSDIENLADEGLTHTEIGKKLGITRQKVTKILYDSKATQSR